MKDIAKPHDQMTPWSVLHIHPASYAAKSKIRDIQSQMHSWCELTAALESALSYQIKSVLWRLAKLTCVCVWFTVLSDEAIRESWFTSKIQTQQITWCILSVMFQVFDSFSLNGTIMNNSIEAAVWIGNVEEKSNTVYTVLIYCLWATWWV